MCNVSVREEKEMTTTIIEGLEDNIISRVNVSTELVCQEEPGHPISRTEALRIAEEILETAEKERILFAEYEAVRGVKWENIP